MQLILQNTDFVVVNKPAGIAVQNEFERAGILPQLCQQLDLPKLWLVHRLDKVTSGCLLLAKNARAAAELSQSFADRQVDKLYLALATKKPKKKQGKIQGDMRKVRDGKWALSQQQSNPTITQFFSYSISPGLRAFVLKPSTGKTHQLRVALKSLGSPILGDKAYGGAPAERTYLHAYQLNFDYLGKTYCCQALPTQGQCFQDVVFKTWLAELSLQPTLTWAKIRKLA